MAAVAMALFLTVSKAGQISAKDAAAHLKNGAMVIDVRTAGEFNSGHLTNAVNIPLDEIEAVVPQRVTNKNQVLLLHCQSGMCSGMAQQELKKLGYTKAFNLGSYSRAGKIVAGQTE